MVVRAAVLVAAAAVWAIRTIIQLPRQVLTLWWWVQQELLVVVPGREVRARHPISLILLQYVVVLVAAAGRVMAELLVQQGQPLVMAVVLEVLGVQRQ